MNDEYKIVKKYGFQHVYREFQRCGISFISENDEELLIKIDDMQAKFGDLNQAIADFYFVECLGFNGLGVGDVDMTYTSFEIKDQLKQAIKRIEQGLK